MVLAADDTPLDGVALHEPEIDERLLAEERAQTVREALSRLPWRWRRMLELLMGDPPASYAGISDQLGLPVRRLGPTRSQSLEKQPTLLHAPLAAHPGSR